jgi:chaperonin GroES
MIRPLEDRVVLKKKKQAEEKTISGLIIPGSKDDSNEAEVVAIGEGRILPNGKRVPMDVKIGDKVIFNIFAVQKVDYQNEEYLVIYTKDILAVIDEQAN